MTLKILSLLLNLVIVLNACAGLYYIEYQGNCYNSCDSFNMLYHLGIKTCVANCKSSNYLRDGNECRISCNSPYYYPLKFPSNQDDLCVNDCLMFGKVRSSGVCIDSCKSNNLIDYDEHVCQESCNFNIFEDQNEKYCVSNCLVYGKYKNSICADNCKEIGKFVDNEKCEISCNYVNAHLLLTKEENYCINYCYSYDLVRSETNKVCESSCKSPEKYTLIEEYVIRNVPLVTYIHITMKIIVLIANY